MLFLIVRKSVGAGQIVMVLNSLPRWSPVVAAVLSFLCLQKGWVSAELVDYTITFLQFLYFEHQWVVAIAIFYSITRSAVLAESSLNGAFAPFRHVSLVLMLLVFVAAMQPVNRITFIHQLPMLTEQECQWIIDTANRDIKAIGGWTKGRHRAYPTEDIPVARLPEVDGFLKEVVRERLKPAVGAHYSFATLHIDVLDMFLVRYSLEGQRSLQSHVDSGHLSFDVMLSTNATDFEGGGVRYKALGETLSPPKGSVIIHPAKLVHSGVEITSGERYVIVGFTKISVGSLWNNNFILPWRLWGYLTKEVQLKVHGTGESQWSASEPS
ncbi:unnamed protein product [Choristocarpus tenellus]